MKLFLAAGAVALGFVVVMLGGPWIGMGNQLLLYRYFAPKTEAVRREVFEQSKAYRQGLAQELQNMQFQYEQASPEHKAVLRSVILRRVADVPNDVLTSDLQAFVSSLRREQ